uniref:Multicopper oxidase n=1 Tax=Rhizophora mucronata TaxID=61149 RepID=A0A2P2K5U8_RHIMU
MLPLTTMSSSMLETNWMKICSCIGLEFNRGGAHGKTEFLALTVRFLQSGTGLTSFRSKIRLGVSFISLLSICRELLVDMAASL